MVGRRLSPLVGHRHRPQSVPMGGRTSIVAYLHRATSPVAVIARVVGGCAVQAATLIVNDDDEPPWQTLSPRSGTPTSWSFGGDAGPGRFRVPLDFHSETSLTFLCHFDERTDR